MLQVNEIFGPTVQGEGKNAGKPVAFLRLAVCNLHCFKCDTPFTWFYEGVKATHIDGVQFNRTKEIHPMSTHDVIATLIKTDMNSLVISGGEPLLQQRQLLPLLTILKSVGWFIEVETNGTQVITPGFASLVDQINCSPKLDSSFSGEPHSLRIRDAALTSIVQTGKANFKFVIAEPENIAEALLLIKQFDMKEVRLMPECRTNEEMEAKEQWVRQLCEQHNLIYCTRLSIKLSGTLRGV